MPAQKQMPLFPIHVLPADLVILILLKDYLSVASVCCSLLAISSVCCLLETCCVLFSLVLITKALSYIPKESI